MMHVKKVKIGRARVDYFFSAGMAHLHQVTDPKTTILITDENIFQEQGRKFKKWRTLVIPAGEEFKTQQTIDKLVGQLLNWEADRKTTLVGVGGGVITDITGYLATVYMRGIRFGFIPTSILGLVDASIGGKNGVDVGDYKNIVGAIRQPSFILHDIGLLGSLPEEEWVNGFSEIIKHAAIRDLTMFRSLESNNLKKYRSSRKLICELVERNVMLKTRVVQLDEFEQKERRLLNFGHTLGHAIENQYGLPHGHAVSIGMSFAARLSQSLLGFREQDRLNALLEKYGLPTSFSYDKEKVFEVLKMDKKRERKDIHFILLEKVGKGVIKTLPLERLHGIL